MKKRKSRKLLRVALAICALIPIITGILGMSGNQNPIYGLHQRPEGLLLDSNLRFLNGLSVGVGLCALSIARRIRTRSAELKIVCAIMFCGAIGRILSVAHYGLPPSPFDIAALFELALPPVLLYWQSRVSA